MERCIETVLEFFPGLFLFKIFLMLWMRDPYMLEEWANGNFMKVKQGKWSPVPE